MSKKKAYVCGVDWQHEIGEVNDVKLYSSIEVLKEERTCWKECGIVELELSLVGWVEPQDLELNGEDFKSKPKKKKRSKKIES